MSLRRSSVSALALLAVVSLAGCNGINAAGESLDRVGRLTDDQKARQAAAMRGDVHRVNRPYYGEAVVVERGATKGKPLPKNVEGPRSFNLSGQKLGIKELAAEVSKQTGLITQVKTRYITPDGASLTVPIGGKVGLKYEGSLSKALDKIAAMMDIDWSYDGDVIAFNRMITQDYRVSLPTGTSAMQTSIGGVNGGSRSVTMSRTIAEYSPWDDLEQRLERAAPPPADVTISRSAGRISVFGPPSVQAQALAVVSDFENTFAARIGLEVAVFFVDSSKADDFGVGVNVSGSSGNFTGGVNGAAGLLAGNGVTTLSRGTSSISFKALASDSSVVDYRIGSTIAQSGVISPIILTRSQNYVAKSTTTTDNGVSSTAIETATVDTGVSIHALPRLVGKDKIQLSLTLLQNDLTELTSFDSGNSTVQLPTIDQRAIQNDSVLSPGETLVLSGYEQESSSRSNNGTGASGFLGLGGSVKGSKRKIKMVVMVRPAIIPMGRE
jgi:type IVB pilus formation R64 PilN family outer membrane protein